MSEKPYLDFTKYLQLRFPSMKVQKISVNAGFTCPNRDGSKGRGGCTYCNNSSFSPEYTQTIKSVTVQLNEGIKFFSYKYPEMKYLAYFQSYTNTYDDIERLKALYEEALSVPGVVGLIVGTRPDCVTPELLEYFKELSRKTFVYLEYGVESTSEETLKAINRGHTFEESAAMICQTAAAGLPVGAHLIIGLPNEDREDYRAHIQRLSELPLTSLKLHQLQILKGTVMGRDYLKDPTQFNLLTADEYIDILCDLLAICRPTLYIDRFVSQAPSELLIAPRWDIKNYIFTHRVEKRMRELNLIQGCKYKVEG
ncbi:TIGR01212 family radical SAM protein [Porphyromonadaceae bacterium W3.11]|nr:TIGR01212 family radical SAM protein [Porphyromonadaceae bacterium W3.11]